MEAITKIEFKEKHHAIEVDGIKYEIPQRTALLENKIREHDKNVKNMSEYEGNYSMLVILFGEEAAQRMFPDGENTNLDKLALVTNTAIERFMLEYNKQRADSLNKKIEEMKPMLSTVDKVNAIAVQNQNKKHIKAK